jgi:excinuclease UvrABC nuclease subunit
MTTPTSSRSVGDNAKPLPLPDPPIRDALSDSIDRFLQKNTYPPLEHCDAIVERLKVDRFEALRCEAYGRARQLEDAINKLTEYSQSEMVNDLKLQEIDIVNERLGQAHENLRLRLQEWTDIFRIFRNEQTAEHSAILGRQEREEKLFEENWSNPAYMISFAKPSHALNSLRKQQKSFALMKDFETAERVKREAEALERAETASAAQRAEASLRLAYEAMTRRHRREIETFLEHQRQREAYLEKERQHAIDPIERLIAQLEIARDRDRPLNLNPRPVTRNARRPRVMPVKRPETRLSVQAVKTIGEYRFADAPDPLPVPAPAVGRIVPALRARTARRDARR